MAIAFMGIFLLIVVAFMFFRKKSSGKIERAYISEAGKFRVEGKENRFVIQKDDRFEFLVENGVITACKDRTRHKEFVYYRGKEDV